MMAFKDFLQWVRSSGERYVVLDADGEPEFVIEPFPTKSAATKAVREKSSVEIINETIAEVAQKERQEVPEWDTMVDTLHDTTTQETAPSETKPEEEPRFQFETIDE